VAFRAPRDIDILDDPAAFIGAPSHTCILVYLTESGFAGRLQARAAAT
jgi:hypothetical protein